MKWSNEQLDTLAEVYISHLIPVIIHCEDWKDRERVEKYMQENHPIVDYEVVIGADEV